MSELVTIRGKNPLLWPDFIFDKLKSGKENKETLKILHGVTNEVSLFYHYHENQYW